MLGGKITYERDLSDGLLTFASLSRGYKSGGLNVDARQINPATDPLTYNTEHLWNTELGLRGNWWDGKLTSALTGFYLQRQDTQVRDSAGAGGNFRFFEGNGGDARITGVELESNLQATAALSFYASMGLMNSHIQAFTLNNGGTGGGRELTSTPAFAWSLGTRYQHASGFFATLDMAGRDEYFESNEHAEKRDGFMNINTSIGFTKDDWTVSLWVRNLIDEQYTQRVFFFGNEDPTYTPARYESLAPPRQIGVTVRREF